MSFVGERKALAAAVLSLYTLLYLLNTLMAPGEEYKLLFAALTSLYALAFLSVVAGYFWGRWFAIGLGLFGVIGGVMALIQMGIDYTFLFYGGTHGIVSLALTGKSMARDFDGRTEWRERFHLDENGTRRLGKAVIRIGVTLPVLVIYGLAPSQGMGASLLSTALVGLVGLGVFGLLRMRTWGVALIGLCALGLGASAVGVSTSSYLVYGADPFMPTQIVAFGLALLLASCVAPFAGPIKRFLAR